jgi:enamine deaminase RidA (YjgF/YER057c/UK114 family)
VKIGINRSKVDISVQGTVFTIGIVPIQASLLIAQHDNEEDLDKQIELMFETVEAILIANGYEFHRSWWEQNCDLEMLQEFVVFSLQKDIPKTKSKKKAQVSS